MGQILQARIPHLHIPWPQTPFFVLLSRSELLTNNNAIVHLVDFFYFGLFWLLLLFFCFFLLFSFFCFQEILVDSFSCFATSTYQNSVAGFVTFVDGRSLSFEGFPEVFCSLSSTAAYGDGADGRFGVSETEESE
jgi:hypothetical protein